MVSIAAKNFSVGFFKGDSTGLDDKKSKVRAGLGLGSDLTLEARAWLRLKKYGLVPLLVQRGLELKIGKYVSWDDLLLWLFWSLPKWR